MKMNRAAVVAGLVLVVGVMHMACDHPTGPSLTADIGSYRLVPSSDVANASRICCCRVQGVVRNTSSITVHISLRFQASGRDGAALGTALDFLADVPAGESRPYDAPGIYEPCSQVANVTPDVLVIGNQLEPEP